MAEPKIDVWSMETLKFMKSSREILDTQSIIRDIFKDRNAP